MFYKMKNIKKKKSLEIPILRICYCKGKKTHIKRLDFQKYKLKCSCGLQDRKVLQHNEKLTTANQIILAL